jgi:hypothetical protein
MINGFRSLFPPASHQTHGAEKSSPPDVEGELWFKGNKYGRPCCKIVTGCTSG